MLHSQIRHHIAVVLERVRRSQVEQSKLSVRLAEKRPRDGGRLCRNPAPRLLAILHGPFECSDELGLCGDGLLDAARLVLLSARRRAAEVLRFGDVSHQLRVFRFSVKWSGDVPPLASEFRPFGAGIFKA